MSDDLRDDLKTIDGIGDAKADAILDILADHDLGSDSAYVTKAKDAAAEGNYREAAIYLNRAGDE